MMGRAGKRSVLLAAIAAFASGCAQLGIPLRNREAESAQAHRRMMLTLADKVETYLVTGDLASAQRAALDYRAERDADPTLLAEWRRRIWTMSESWGGRDGSRQTKREIEGAVAERRRRYAHERKMSREAFVQWLAKQGATQDEPLFSKIDVRDGSVQLWVTKEHMPALDFNMKKLAEINDALVARCGCAGRTNVGTSDTGFPVYLVRLEPETRQSQVIVLPR
jgi:hypothetical protein